MPKVIDHDERRREIIEVAKSIILKGGFEAATMRSIAAEAGFANGALKHYFDGKDAIVAATFQSALDDYETGLEERGLIPGVAAPTAEEQSAYDRLREFLRLTLLSDTDGSGNGRVLLALWEYAMSNEDLAELYRTHLSNWQAKIVALMEAARDEGSISAGLPYGALADEFVTVGIGVTVVVLIQLDGGRLPDYEAYIDGFLARLKG